MSSSTSSSEVRTDCGTPFATVLRLLLGAAGPSVLAALLLISVFEVWYRLDPSDQSIYVDDVIVLEQMERAGNIEGAEVLIAGDSSALMDVDPVELGEALGGLRVESLATVGWVGPAGIGRLLEEQTRRKGEIPVLLLLLHGVSLSLDEATFSSRGYEEMVLQGRRERPTGLPGTGARRKLFSDLIAPVVAFPLPGTYARVYGWPEDVRRTMRESHGGLANPNPPLPSRPAASGPPFRHQLSPAVEERLDALRRSLDRVHPQRIFFGLTPIPASCQGPETEQQREALQSAVTRHLGLSNDTVLPLPAALPDPLFADLTHLVPEGRRLFTEHLGALLRSRF